MKLTFLGTGAGEGYPGLWCQCPHCTYARENGGKNIRANSCAVLDGALLLDMGPACFGNAARFGLDLSQIKTLLLTHPHEDHLYMQHFIWRMAHTEHIALDYYTQMQHGGPRFTAVPELAVYGNADTEAALAPLQHAMEALKLRFIRIQDGQSFEADGYTITPIRGNHGAKPGFAHSYIVSRNGQTLLYALDSGIFDADMLELLKQYTFNLIIMEGTTGLYEQSGGHMCLQSNLQMKRFFEDNGCMAPDCRFALSHMSPHWCPPHDWYETIVQTQGVMLAYDGMEIEI